MDCFPLLAGYFACVIAYIRFLPSFVQRHRKWRNPSNKSPNRCPLPAAKHIHRFDLCGCSEPISPIEFAFEKGNIWLGLISLENLLIFIASSPGRQLRSLVLVPKGTAIIQVYVYVRTANTFWKLVFLCDDDSPSWLFSVLTRVCAVKKWAKKRSKSRVMIMSWELEYTHIQFPDNSAMKKRTKRSTKNSGRNTLRNENQNIRIWWWKKVEIKFTA